MHESREHLQTLTEIRSLMERSSKFLSLSGLSGVWAGLVALVGAGVAYARLKPGGPYSDYVQRLGLDPTGTLTSPARPDVVDFLLIDALLVLVAALLGGIFFTVRKARQQGKTVWNATSRRLVWAMAVPLLTGGIFCIGLLHHRLLWLASPAMLIFYGLALINGSKYTVRDVEYLGVLEIALGLLAVFLTGHALLLWAVGFGVLHIIYGAVMYWRYDRTSV